MVFSHALIVPLDEAAELPTLKPLVELLAEGPERPTAVPSLILPDARYDSSGTASELRAVADALTLPGSGPVVRLGTKGFEEVIVALWSHLWKSIRRGFAFRLSFGPQDLTERPSPAIVCTPPTLASRWGGYRIVGRVGKDRSHLASAVLTGDAPGSALCNFANDFGVEVTQFAELLLLERAYEIYASPSDKFESLIGALRILGKLSPSSSRGVLCKEGLITRLSNLLISATIPELMLLRNLNLAAFAQSDRIWNAVSARVGEDPFAPRQDPEMLAALADASREAAALAEWQTAFWEGVHLATMRKSVPLAPALWRWWREAPNLLVPIFDHLPAERSLDDYIADAAPLDLPTDLAEQVMHCAYPREWSEVSAAAASAGFPPAEAVRRQIALGNDPSNMQGVKRALRKGTPMDVILAAGELGDPRLVEMGGEVAAKDPTLLLRIDVETATGQAIWAQALELNSDAWSGPANPEMRLEHLLQSLLHGSHVRIDLLLALGRSPLANLANFARRAELWSQLSDVPRELFLAATADGWLHRFAQGHTSTSPPEPELENAICEEGRLGVFLAHCLPDDIAGGAHLFVTLKQTTEQQFIKWVREVVAVVFNLSSSDAAAVGGVVDKRRWSRAADVVGEIYRSGRTDLTPALRAFYSQLGLWTRFWLGIVPLSSSEKWQLLEDTATKLYPHGPDEMHLWERAGGDNADLQQGSSGRWQWHEVIRKIRSGHEVTSSQLITTMITDFPHNNELRFLAQDVEFAIAKAHFRNRTDDR
jgi:hypothetical protein